jgi:hypothetical protein
VNECKPLVHGDAGARAAAAAFAELVRTAAGLALNRPAAGAYTRSLFSST